MIDIYANIYDLITTYIFGGVLDSSNEELITICLSSIACIFVFALPFLVIWKVIKLIMN